MRLRPALHHSLSTAGLICYDLTRQEDGLSYRTGKKKPIRLEDGPYFHFFKGRWFSLKIQSLKDNSVCTPFLTWKRITLDLTPDPKEASFPYNFYSKGQGPDGIKEEVINWKTETKRETVCFLTLEIITLTLKVTWNHTKQNKISVEVINAESSAMTFIPFFPLSPFVIFRIRSYERKCEKKG